jgi:predicted enzyme related to lactoylglutathione lyase
MPEPKLSLLVIRSSDIERAAAAYRVLGLDLAKERHGSGPEHYACVLGDCVFEIYPRRGNADTSSVIRLGFRVASVEETVAMWKDHGCKVVTEAQESEWGMRAVLEDPDGHRIELTERRS